MTAAPDMAAWRAQNAAQAIAAVVRELVDQDAYTTEQAEELALVAGLFFDPESVPHAMRRLALTIEGVLADGARAVARVRFDQLAWIAAGLERELARGDAAEGDRARLILELSEITPELTGMIRSDLLAHVEFEPADDSMARATMRMAPEVPLYPLETVAERLVRHLATGPRSKPRSRRRRSRCTGWSSSVWTARAGAMQAHRSATGRLRASPCHPTRPCARSGRPARRWRWMTAPGGNPSLRLASPPPPLRRSRPSTCLRVARMRQAVRAAGPWGEE